MKINKLVTIIHTSAHSYPEKIFSKKGANYTCINPYSYGILRKKPELVDKFDGIFVDGISMCWWIRVYYRIKIPRLSFDMTTIAKDFFDYLSLTGKSVYFIGAKEEEVRETIKRIQQEFPDINISGYRNGYFNNIDERNYSMERIVNTQPSYVVIGMGTPLQEQYMVDLRASGYEGTCFTCGGYLRQAANGIHYFPDWAEKYNLRAIYRQFKEKGLFGRLYDTLIKFPILFTKDYIKDRKK